MGINGLDLFAVIALLFFIFSGVNKGLIRTVFDFFSFILALFAAYFLHPVIAGAMRQNSQLYAAVKSAVVESAGLDAFVAQAGKSAETQLIQTLPLPQLLKQPLIENNNPEIYKILDASGFADYIAGFIANLIIGAAALLLAFIVALILIRVLAAILDVFTKLPVVHALNKTGGAFAGLLIGIVFLWIAAAVSVFVLLDGDATGSEALLQTSLVAKYFYLYNPPLQMILQILP